VSALMRRTASGWMLNEKLETMVATRWSTRSKKLDRKKKAKGVERRSEIAN
jgi:hypothetical protein